MWCEDFRFILYGTNVSSVSATVAVGATLAFVTVRRLNGDVACVNGKSFGACTLGDDDGDCGGQQISTSYWAIHACGRT